MDVEEQELAGSNDDHDGTDKLSIARAGMLVFRSLSEMRFTHHCMCLVTSDDTLQTFHAESMRS